MRVGQVYIDLCEAGDDQYLTWSKEVRCSENRLPTRRSRSINGELADISLTMENRLRVWQTTVHTKRTEYKELNHFTTKQMLAMRRELGMLRLASCPDIPLPVYTLLESIHADVTSQELSVTLNEVLGFRMNVHGTAGEEEDAELEER
jgi:hypothetical protein